MLCRQQPQDPFGKVADRSSSSQQERSVFMRSQCSVGDVRLTPWVTEHPVLLALVIVFHPHAACCVIQMRYSYSPKGSVCYEQPKKL